jgi:hypothetical protein
VDVEYSAVGEGVRLLLAAAAVMVVVIKATSLSRFVHVLSCSTPLHHPPCLLGRLQHRQHHQAAHLHAHVPNQHHASVQLLHQRLRVHSRHLHRHFRPFVRQEPPGPLIISNFKRKNPHHFEFQTQNF